MLRIEVFNIKDILFLLLVWSSAANFFLSDTFQNYYFAPNVNEMLLMSLTLSIHLGSFHHD